MSQVNQRKLSIKFDDVLQAESFDDGAKGVKSLLSLTMMNNLNIFNKIGKVM